MRKVITFVIIFAAVGAIVDSSTRAWVRHSHGPGLELKSGQILIASLADRIHPAGLTKGNRVRFRIRPGGKMSSTALGDGALKDALLEASVTDVGISAEIGQPLVVFEFQSLAFTSGQRYEFKGSIYSPDDPAHMKDSGILGSFVGMEFGPLGVVGGFLLGTLVPYYHGRSFAAPPNYAIGDIEAGEEVLIKVHYADYVPFRLPGHHVHQPTKTKSVLNYANSSSPETATAVGTALRRNVTTARSRFRQ